MEPLSRRQSSWLQLWRSDTRIGNGKVEQIRDGEVKVHPTIPVHTQADIDTVVECDRFQFVSIGVLPKITIMRR